MGFYYGVCGEVLTLIYCGGAAACPFFLLVEVPGGFDLAGNYPFRHRLRRLRRAGPFVRDYPLLRHCPGLVAAEWSRTSF